MAQVFNNTQSLNFSPMAGALSNKITPPVLAPLSLKNSQSTPMGYVQVPSSNATNNAYGQTTSAPISSTISSNPSYTIPSNPTYAQSQTAVRGATTQIPTPAPVSTDYSTGATPTVQNSYQAPTQTTQGAPNSNLNGLYAQIVSALSNTQQSPYNQQATNAIGQLASSVPNNQALGQQAQDIANAAGQQISNIGKTGAQAEAGYLTTGTTPVAQGNAGVIAQTTAAEQQAVSQGANTQLQGIDKALTAQNQTQSGYNQAGGLALSGQGTAQSGLNQAGGLAQPVQISPGNALVNPLTGSESYSGLGGLTGLGIAQQNIKQGQAFQDEAANLSTTLQQIDTLTPTLTSFLDQAGINNENTPYFNQSLKTYLQQVKNPASVASANAMLADLKTYTAQVLGSSGLNPTEVSQTIASFDPSDLSPSQLESFISNLRNLGQIRLKPLQDSAAASYGANGSRGNAYQGQAASPSTQSAFSPDNANSLNSSTGNNQVIQGLIGSGINAVQGFEGLIKGIAGKLLN